MHIVETKRNFSLESMMKTLKRGLENFLQQKAEITSKFYCLEFLKRLILIDIYSKVNFAKSRWDDFDFGKLCDISQESIIRKYQIFVHRDKTQRYCQKTDFVNPKLYVTHDDQFILDESLKKLLYEIMIIIPKIGKFHLIKMTSIKIQKAMATNKWDDDGSIAKACSYLLYRHPAYLKYRKIKVQ